MKRYFAAFKEARSLRRKEKFIVLSLIPLYFILIGLFLQPINEIIPGIIRIVREPDVLITDYFAVGGIGAALINAGLTTQTRTPSAFLLDELASDLVLDCFTFPERKWTAIRSLLPA